MNILGVSAFFHDSAAVLVRSGSVIAGVAEERLSRVKHDAGFPKKALEYCLQQGGISIQDIDAICFYEKPLQKLERELWQWRQFGTTSVEGVRAAVGGVVGGGLSLKEYLQRELQFEGQVLYCDHHLSHAASAFYPSPFDEAVIVTVDGVGEWATTQISIGRGNEITPVRTINYPNSLGLFYSAITSYLGFQPNEDEYKVMGLAAYGQPGYVAQLKQIISLLSDGSFELDRTFFEFGANSQRLYSAKLTELLGAPRAREGLINQREMDIAASLQAVLEEALLSLIKTAREIGGGISNLCLAGGVALNCVCNARIVESSLFNKVWIQPAAGDDGGALGAALQASGKSLVRGKKFSPYMGPEYSNEEIQEALVQNGNSWQFVSDDELCEICAQALVKNKIIGWFQGRMEFGPRALGSRSILANPCNPDMKHILNESVKFREEFRPFAPAVTAEAAGRYFTMPFESPYMLFAVKVQEQASVIPAVVHQNKRARVQTVAAEDQNLFHKLINAVGRVNGIPVVINTSFNIRGEPIVCSPVDAIRCFEASGIDILAIGNFILTKENCG